MKNAELDRILQSASVPKRSETHWTEFPKRVMARAQWLQTHTESEASDSRNRPLGFLSSFKFAAAGLGLVVIGLFLAVYFGLRQGGLPPITDPQLAAAREYWREIGMLFPHQIQAIVLDHGAPQIVLADQPDIPASSPLYLRVYSPKGSQNFVTFSGQQINLNGEICEVLLDHEGKVLLMGQHQVWPSGHSGGKNAIYQVAARLLEKTL